MAQHEMKEAPGTFSVGNDLLNAFEGAATEKWWAMMEWAAGFYERTKRPARLRDFMQEMPPMQYRGMYE